MAYDIAKRFKNCGVVTTIDNITYAGYTKILRGYKITINPYKSEVVCVGKKDTIVIDLYYWREIRVCYGC